MYVNARFTEKTRSTALGCTRKVFVRTLLHFFKRKQRQDQYKNFISVARNPKYEICASDIFLFFLDYIQKF